MSENPTKNTSPKAPIVSFFHTVLAAENKTSELYVKSFHYQGENVATSHLGQIFGFFEIPDTEEDNAYIVNFLASVVKKEYFVNPKRSATDSFEAALHKINLALTELVKQGNTGWLGKLHGVVSVLENNTLHFSVTGDGAILLYRENQVTTISEGLADKDAALHPLKTFLEISSGVLLPNDKVLITSPEIFTLCPPEILRKNAFRMDKNGFARFVRAALVNELPLGVSLIIDIEKETLIPLVKKKAKELREQSQEKLQNVFSGSSFNEDGSRKEELEPTPEESEDIPIEYTDKKTGHIYVQGEFPEHAFSEPPLWKTFYREKILPLFKTLKLSLKRFTKKSRKSIAKQAGVVGVESKELGQKLWNVSKKKSILLAEKGNTTFKNRLISIRKSAKSLEAHDATISILPPGEEEYELAFQPPISESVPSITASNFPEESISIQPEVPAINSRQKMLEKFSHGYVRPKKEKSVTGIKLFFLRFFSQGKKKMSLLGKKITKLSTKQKILVVLVIIAVLLVTFFILNQRITSRDQNMETLEDQNAENVDTENVPADSPPVAIALPEASTPSTWNEGTALLTFTNENSVITVISNAIVVNEKSFPFPLESTIESATYMPDLKTVFLWSNKRELIAWNIVDQKFITNTFPLASNVSVGSLGSYLTYLYVLDKENGQIYRFARIEGGFSEPTKWLKAPLPAKSIQAFAVTDTIKIANGTALDQYLQGTKEKTLAEGNYSVLGLSSERNFTIGVNTITGKITVWNVDGNQVYDNTFEELKNISTITYRESDKKLFVSKDQNTVEYSLSW